MLNKNLTNKRRLANKLRINSPPPPLSLNLENAADPRNDLSVSSGKVNLHSLSPSASVKLAADITHEL